MSITVDHKLAGEICDALGLKNVRRLDLHFSVDAAPTAEVLFFPDENGVKAIIPLLKRYTLSEMK